MVCVGAFADGAGYSGLAPLATGTAEAPTDLIVVGKQVTYLKADCCIVVVITPWIGIYVVITSPPL